MRPLGKYAAGCATGVGRTGGGSASAEFAQDNSAGIAVFDHAGRKAAHTHKTKSTQDSFGTEMFRQKLFVPQTVLQCQEHRLLVQQRRKKRKQIWIRRRL